MEQEHCSPETFILLDIREFSNKGTRLKIWGSLLLSLAELLVYREKNALFLEKGRYLKINHGR